MNKISLLLMLVAFSAPCLAEDLPALHLEHARLECFAGKPEPDIILGHGQTMEGFHILCLTNQEAERDKSALSFIPVDEDGNQPCIVFRKDRPMDLTLNNSQIMCAGGFLLFEPTKL